MGQRGVRGPKGDIGMPGIPVGIVKKTGKLYPCKQSTVQHLFFVKPCFRKAIVLNLFT